MAADPGTTSTANAYQPASPTPAALLEKLDGEARRCERYNHFCSLLLLDCRNHDPGRVYARVREQLRSTDYVELLGGAHCAPMAQNGRRPCRIAAILPETAAGGARTAMQRLQGLLPDIADVQFGLAVYPDDGTDAPQLLRAASPSAA